jgi:hypothetical protein
VDLSRIGGHIDAPGESIIANPPIPEYPDEWGTQHPDLALASSL